MVQDSAKREARAIDAAREKVVITGAAGAIGSALRQGMAERFRNLLLTDLRVPADAAAGEDWVAADIADRPALDGIMQGAAAVIHLAGAASSDLETLWRVNARGMFDVFEAAQVAGVRRIVFASSNHAHGSQPIGFPVSPDHLARPDGHYGAMKAYGELILRSYFDRYGIRSVSLRIGTYRPLPIDQRSLATWLSPADMVQLAERSLLHADPGALVVNAYSNNTHLKVARTYWDFLGYAPVDNAEEHREMLRGMGIDVDGDWEYPEHGGNFARDPELPARLISPPGR